MREFNQARTALPTPSPPISNAVRPTRIKKASARAIKASKPGAADDTSRMRAMAIFEERLNRLDDGSLGLFRLIKQDFVRKRDKGARLNKRCHGNRIFVNQDAWPKTAKIHCSIWFRNQCTSNKLVSPHPKSPYRLLDRESCASKMAAVRQSLWQDLLAKSCLARQFLAHRLKANSHQRPSILLSLRSSLAGCATSHAFQCAG